MVLNLVVFELAESIIVVIFYAIRLPKLENLYQIAHAFSFSACCCAAAGVLHVCFSIVLRVGRISERKRACACSYL